MAELIIACVNTGTKYVFDHVINLRNAVARHLKIPYTMVCLTDQRQRCSGVAFVDIAALELHGWWGKMALFEPMWRDNSKVVYLDLDSKIVGDISPLAAVPGEFSILAAPNYPINTHRFDSSAMVIGGGQCGFVWERFDRWHVELMTQYRGSGDKAVIQELYPSAQILQAILPKDFFGNTIIQGD
jgi:hypothetical protein